MDDQPGGVWEDSVTDEVVEPPVKQARLAPNIVPKRAPRPRGSLALEESLSPAAPAPAPARSPRAVQQEIPRPTLPPRLLAPRVRPTGPPVQVVQTSRPLIRPTGVWRPAATPLKLHPTPKEEQADEEEKPEPEPGQAFERGMVVSYDGGTKFGYIDMKLDGADACYLCDEDTKASIRTAEGKSRSFKYSELQWNGMWTDKIQVEEVLPVDPYTMRRLAAKEDLEVELFQKWQVVVQLDAAAPTGPQIQFGPASPAALRAVVDVMKKNVAMLRSGRDPFVEPPPQAQPAAAGDEEAGDGQESSAPPKAKGKLRVTPKAKPKARPRLSADEALAAMQAEGVWKDGDPAEAPGQHGQYTSKEWEAWKAQNKAARGNIKIEVEEDDDDTWGDWKPEEAIKQEAPDETAAEGAGPVKEEQGQRPKDWNSWGQQKGSSWSGSNNWNQWNKPHKGPAPPEEAAKPRPGQPLVPPDSLRPKADWRFKRKPYFVDNVTRKVSSVGIMLREKKDLQARGRQSQGIPWGTEVDGIDEGDGWMKLPEWWDHYLPFELDGSLVIHQLRKWRTDPSQLKASGSGLAVRLTKSLLAPAVDRIAWGTEILAVDLGDGWVRSGERYMPTHFQNGQRVLVPVEDEEAVIHEPDESNGKENDKEKEKEKEKETAAEGPAAGEGAAADSQKEAPTQAPTILPTALSHRSPGKKPTQQGWQQSQGQWQDDGGDDDGGDQGWQDDWWQQKQPKQQQQQKQGQPQRGQQQQQQQQTLEKAPTVLPLWARIESLGDSLLDKFDTSAVTEYVRPKKAPPPPRAQPTQAQTAGESGQQQQEEEQQQAGTGNVDAAEGAEDEADAKEEGDGASPVYDEPLSNYEEEATDKGSKKQDPAKARKPHPPKGPPPPDDSASAAPGTPVGLRAEAAQKKVSGPLPIGADTPAFPAGGATPFLGGPAPAASSNAMPQVTLPTGTMTIEDWAENQQQFAHLPPLPPSWIRIRSQKSGQIYYVNTQTGKTQFEEPSDLPEHWVKMVSRSTGRTYYYHTKRHESTFDKPTS